MEINNGIYSDLSNHDYHSSGAISRSGIMDFLNSPYRYWANYLNPKRPSKETTLAMAFGSAFHTLMLEPLRFDEQYIMKPAPVLLKDVGREAYDKHKDVCDYIEKSGKTVLSINEWQHLMAMEDSLKSNHEAIMLILDGQMENSYFWTDVHSGLQIKARPDILHYNIIVDLKTCTSAHFKAYQRAMIDGGYHIQGAMISDGIYELTGTRIKKVINICIEKTYPYAIAIYFIDESAIEHGHQQYKQALLDMKYCFENNKWASYETQSIGIPAWAI
jgi:exodeoxyribonuclease VIII